MARIVWLLGTVVAGIAIAGGSWFAVRELTRSVQAAAPGGDVLAQSGARNQTQPAPRAGGQRAANNFNDREAPSGATQKDQPKNFIGALRESLDKATDLDIDKDEYLKSLDKAEAEFERIKRENRAALRGMNRRPPISVAQSPNYVLIDMPGLGYSDLAVFSPEAKADQAIDALAEAGLIFTHYYAASASPTANACSLLTGLHSGRARLRADQPVAPLAVDDITLAESLWRAGYATCMIGQWRLGGADSSGAPTRQGFDRAWFATGPNDEAPVVFSNQERLANNEQPADWAEFQTRGFDQAISFFEQQRGQPVFVYLSLPVDETDGQQLSTRVDEQLERLTTHVRAMKLARETYFFLVGSPGGNLPESAAPDAVEPVEPIEQATPSELSQANDTPAPVSKAPAAIPLRDDSRANQARRIIPGAKAPPAAGQPSVKVIETEFPPTSAEATSTSQERQVQPATAEDVKDNVFIEQLKHREPVQVRAAREVAGLRGAPAELHEGGLRAPLIVWTTRRPLGGVRNEVVAAWDLFPTLTSLSYSQFVPSYLTGVSFATRLQVHGDTAQTPLHPVLYWETHGDRFDRALLYGKWKAIQSGPDGPVELYNLESDPRETRDVAAQQTKLVERLEPLFDRMRGPSRLWPLPGEANAQTEPARGE